jgi:branched-chain amino acid transport system ATP-binding protein
VHTHIGQYHILQGVDLAVPRGGLAVLLGRNGAGKTTTLRTIMGLWKASAGSHRVRRPRHHEAGDARHRPRRHRLRPGKHGRVLGADRAREPATWRRATARSTRSGVDWICGFFPALKKFWNYPAGKLSGGQKQMVAIARAIVEPRKLLLVDEPTKGLAPAIVQSLMRAFRELKDTSTTILLVEQNFNFVRTLGDSVA